MFCKTLKLSFLLVFTFCAPTLAGDANDCIQLGRAYIFDGNLSGLRMAYQTFDDCLNDQNCLDCSSSRELKFLHAVTRTAMLVVRDDGNSIDSVFELGKQFSIDVLGDYWAPYFDPCGLELSAPSNQHDAYEIPDGAPDANEIHHIIDTNMIPEIEEIINDLNSISDSPGDRFRIFFDPNETRIFFDVNALGLETDVEVDYGEVLILKGLLTSLKARLQAQAAYDMCIDANDMLVEKVYGDSFNINADLFQPHPDLLNVLPTPNYPDANGKAILAQARQDWIDSIDYYFYTIDYIRNEEDPQEDDLIYIDPNDDYIVDEVDDRLTTLRDSLENDTIATFPVETTKTYDINDVNGVPIGQLVLVYNFTGIEGDDGSLTFTDSNLAPSPWEVDWFERVEANWIEIELEYYSESEWGQGWFEGALSYDGNSITNGTFEYWGSANGNLTGLSGRLTGTKVEDVNVDLNPIFGSSPNYPDPVNPRDLLPVFDEWNGPQPNTVGHGLPNPNDPTLGGISPDMTQYDWQVEFDLQPSGLFYLDSISPGQVIVDGNIIDDWTNAQLVLLDIEGDTWEDSNTILGVDIDKFYMAHDGQNLYGAITFYDNIDNNDHFYDLRMSYSPDNDSLHTIRLEIYVYDGSATGSMYYRDPGWNYVGSFETVAGPNAVEFKVPDINIPADYLWGRFISLLAEAHDGTWSNWDGEENMTHLRIAVPAPQISLCTISGTVTYNGYKGAPIFVQAYTDLEEPEDSIVASTIITEPNLYTLEGIGFGWEGYVRAFTPLFGFNVFDLGALTIQDSAPVFLYLENLEDVNLVLNNPVILEKDVWVPGEINTQLDREDWYAFDAVQGGNYALDVNRLTSLYASMTLYDRNGYDEIQELYHGQTQHIDWICPVSGRYYVEVTDNYWLPEGGTYQIRMTSDLTCPQADIASAQWVGVKDCRVDLYDLYVVFSHWLDDCAEPYWCDDSDFDESGSIDFVDFAALADEWLHDAMP
jgi:hypothetical protein